MAMNVELAQDDMHGLRVFLEELVGHLCRCEHVAGDALQPSAVHIRQEVALGPPQSFADLQVSLPGGASYFVEVDLGYSREQLLASLRRKYGTAGTWADASWRLVLLVEPSHYPDWERLQAELLEMLAPQLKLDVWDLECLRELVARHLRVELDVISPPSLQRLRQALEAARGQLAFGDAYANEPLDATLLWQFSHWRLKQMFEQVGRNKRRLLEPGHYSGVVVVFADLCGFSGYVRDSIRHRTIRDCLAAFCSKARYQVVNDGGMLYQYLGDAVIGLFGIPERTLEAPVAALGCARALLDIASSVTFNWQRQIDRIQPVSGAHIGMSLGDLELLPLRPFSRTHMGAVGDSINLAARLCSAAQPGEIVISNMLHQELPHEMRASFRPIPSVEARNVGRIKAWALAPAETVGQAPPS